MMTMRRSCPVLALVLAAAFANAAPQKPPTQSQPASPPAKTGTTKRAPATPPEDFDKLRARADAARETDQIPEAISLYRELVQIRPKWSEGWWYLGALQYEQDQFADAAEAFRKHVVLEPVNGQAWAMLGLCEFRAREYAKSLQYLTKARTLGLGTNEELARVVRYHQALLFTLGRQFEAALKLLTGFAVEHRESPPVVEAMGMAALRIPDLAVNLLPPDLEMARKFGKAQFLLGERKDGEAMEMFRKLETEYRGKANTAYALGAAMLVVGEHEQALKYFKQELEQDPKHVPAMIQYALEAIELERFEDGLVYARRATEVAPDDFAGYYALGRILLYLNDLTGSIATLEKAALLAPDSASVFYTLSQAYLRANRKSESDRALAEFRRLDALEKQRRTGVSPETRESQPNPPRQ